MFRAGKAIYYNWIALLIVQTWKSGFFSPDFSLYWFYPYFLDFYEQSRLLLPEISPHERLRVAKCRGRGGEKKKNKKVMYVRMHVYRSTSTRRVYVCTWLREALKLAGFIRVTGACIFFFLHFFGRIYFFFGFVKNLEGYRLCVYACVSGK